ncbi:hypothetical protein TNCV_1305611 [Trichonephila clavipes]|nr:hypothetical protein TNCV_1305611 [Trichonephila clavipes]
MIRLHLHSGVTKNIIAPLKVKYWAPSPNTNLASITLWSSPPPPHDAGVYGSPVSRTVVTHIGAPVAWGPRIIDTADTARDSYAPARVDSTQSETLKIPNTGMFENEDCTHICEKSAHELEDLALHARLQTASRVEYEASEGRPKFSCSVNGKSSIILTEENILSHYAFV